MAPGYLHRSFKESFRIFSKTSAWAICGLPVLLGEFFTQAMPQPHLFDFWTGFTLALLQILILAFLFEWSYAALYLSTKENHSPTSALYFLKEALSSARRWYPAYCLSLVPILLGSLLVLPGIYFLVIFIFVTPMALRTSKSSLFDLLFLSKQLVSRDFWRLFPLIFFLEFCMVVLGFELQDISQFIQLDIQVPTLVQWIATLLNILLRVWSYVFYSLVFLELWRNYEQNSLRDSGKSRSH